MEKVFFQRGSDTHRDDQKRPIVISFYRFSWYKRNASKDIHAERSPFAIDGPKELLRARSEFYNSEQARGAKDELESTVAISRKIAYWQKSCVRRVHLLVRSFRNKQSCLAGRIWTTKEAGMCVFGRYSDGQSWQQSSQSDSGRIFEKVC